MRRELTWTHRLAGEVCVRNVVTLFLSEWEVNLTSKFKCSTPFLSACSWQELFPFNPVTLDGGIFLSSVYNEPSRL